MFDSLLAVLEEAAGHTGTFDGVNNFGHFLLAFAENITDVHSMNLFGEVLYQGLIDIGILLRAITKEHKTLVGVAFQYAHNPGELGVVVALTGLYNLAETLQDVEQEH